MPDRFDKFTDRARKVLSYAQEEAQRFNHNYIGTEHLLLGLLRDDEGVAGLALRNSGVPLERVRDAVEFIIGRGDQMVLGKTGLTPRSKKVIELAVDEARRLGDDDVGTEHLLLGIVRHGEGIGVGVLESLGVSVHQVHLEVMRIRREISAAAAGVPTGPPLGALLRVVPLAQTREHHGWEVTLLSLESYPGGFVLNGRLLRGGEVDPITIPEPLLVAHDDQGIEYQASPIGSGVDSRTWRFAYRFSPPLDLAARELTVGVAQIGSRHLLGIQQPGATEQVTVGSWSFDIDMSGS